MQLPGGSQGYKLQFMSIISYEKPFFKKKKKRMRGWDNNVSSSQESNSFFSHYFLSFVGDDESFVSDKQPLRKNTKPLSTQLVDS